MGTRKCQVCCEAQSKYKCPSCYVPYCSLACFKKHKEIPCIKTVSSEQNAVKEPSSEGKESAIDQKLPVGRSFNVDDPSEKVLRAQLESLASSSEIRDILKDEKLRKLICKIDSSEVSERELDKAMEGDEFRTLTDKILSAIDNP